MDSTGTKQQPIAEGNMATMENSYFRVELESAETDCYPRIRTESPNPLSVNFLRVWMQLFPGFKRVLSAYARAATTQ